MHSPFFVTIICANNGIYYRLSKYYLEKYSFSKKLTKNPNSFAHTLHWVLPPSISFFSFLTHMIVPKDVT